MNPAAVLAVIVKAQGVAATNAQLNSVQRTLEKTESASTKLGSSMVKTGRKMTSVGKTLSRDVTAPILGIGIAAGVMSAKFNRSMNLIATDAGGSKKEVKGLSTEVLKLAEHSEFGPQKLADSLFFIESAGKRGKTAISDLNKIQKAAMAGNADLETATFGTVGAMNALGKEGKNVEKILATMNAVVGHGHLRLEELTEAMSTGTVGVAKTFGLTFEGFGSALAFFTRMSEPAQQAATRMRQTITHLASASTKKGQEALESIGLSAEKMGEKIAKTGRLGPVIRELAQHLKGLSLGEKNQVLTEAFGGGRFGTQIREGISNVKLLFKTEKEIAKTATVKRLQHSERLTEQQDAVKLKKLWSTVEVQLIKLGDSILPVVVPIFTKLTGVLVSASHWFTSLSAHGRMMVVVFAMIVAAIGPVLVILGTLIRNGGYVIRFFGTMVGWLTKTAPAMDEVAVTTESATVALGAEAEAAQAAAAANAELAASLDAVAVQQKIASAAQVGGMPIGWTPGQQSFASTIPKAQEGAQMSMFAQPAQEAGAAVEAEGATAATGFASSFAAILPGALAVIGIGNILMSVLGGNFESAGYKAGGALVGGIAGFLVGGPAGAAIGVGLGSLVGGIAESVFGPSGPLETKMEHAMRATAKSFQNSVGRSHNAFSGVSDSAHEVKAAAQKVHAATSKVHRAENSLENARSHNSGARKLLQDEIKLKVAKDQLAKANQRVNNSERLQGIRRQLAVRVTKGTVQAEKQRIQTTTRSVKGFEDEAQAALRNGAGQKRLSHISDEITRSSKAKNKAEQALNKTLNEAATQISPKYAQHLKGIKTVQEEMAAAERKATRSVMAQNQLIPNTLQASIQAFNKQKGAVDNSSKSIHHAKEQLGPFQSETKTKMSQATTDVQSFTQAGSKGLSGYAGQLNSFASQLGISNAHFTIGKSKEKTPHKQKGGMVVPGGGTGDRVALTAMVEPGEIVHVLNSRASKDRAKLAGLEHLNKSVPRFAEGGAMGAGGTAAAMAEAQSINSKEYPYVWGGGHGSFAGPYDCSGAVSAVLHAAGMLGKPMVSGELASFGAPGPGPITIYANGVHAFMSIMGKFFGTSLSNPGGGAGFFPSALGLGEAHEGDSGGKFVVRHPTGAGVMSIAKEMFEGPAGQLQKSGQESMDLAQKMSQKWMTKNMPGSFGGGNPNLEGVGGPVAAQAAEIAKRGHAPRIATEALFEALWAESSMGTTAPGNVLEALEPFTKIRPAAQEISGFLYGTPTWTGTSAVSLAGSGLPANAIAQLVQKSGVGEGNEGRANYLPQKGAALASMAQFGLNAGGALAAAAKGKTKKVDPLATSMKNVLTGLTKGKHLPKYQGALKKLGRHIDAIGLGDKELHRLKHLQDLTEEVTKYQEYAENASTLTHSVENPVGSGEEQVIQGLFKGQGEGSWLNQQLGSLLNLRSHVVGEYGIDAPQLPQVKKLLHEANVRLQAVQKAIREAEKRKQELEKKVKEVENEAQKSKTKLESEIKEREHSLSKEENQKKPNKATLETLRGEIHTRKDAISNTDKGSQKEVKELKENIAAIEKGQKARHRDEEGLTGTIIPKLTSKQESIAQLLEGVRGTAGEIEGKGQHIVFSGLQAIQGAGANMEAIGNPPALGSVGGEIFTVQHRLQEIQEEAERAKITSGGNASEEALQRAEEKAQLAEEIAVEARKREMVVAYQTGIMNSFPSVQQIAGPVLPYAGAFAKGGVMMAEVGEKGREVIAAPQGSRVIPSHEVQRAIRGQSEGGNGDLHIGELNVHHDGTVSATAPDGSPLKVRVKKVNREESAKSMARTPGGKGFKR